MSAADRWNSLWRDRFALADARDENVELAAELDRMHDVIVRALEVIDLYRARCNHLTGERDRAVRDLADVLELRSRNDVTDMIERNEP